MLLAFAFLQPKLLHWSLLLVTSRLLLSYLGGVFSVPPVGGVRAAATVPGVVTIPAVAGMLGVPAFTLVLM